MSVSVFHRSRGSGPAVVCLHSSGASSRQWEPLAERLADRYRVVSVDLAGHGRSAGWGDETPSLTREVDRLAPLLRSFEAPMHLVGHSYGGAVAVKIALMHKERVRSLSVFEPVMFRLLLDSRPDDAATVECVTVAGAIRAAMTRGDAGAAARTFVDYWSGNGAWDRVDGASRATIVGRMPAVMGCFDSLFVDDTRPQDLERLDVPALVMSAGRSPLAGKAAAAFLARSLPLARRREFVELGHMGPVTRPDDVNAEIERLIVRTGSASARPFPTERLGSYPWRETLRPA